MDLAPGVLQTFGGIVLGAFLTIGGNYLAKFWDWRKAAQDHFETAVLAERGAVLKAYQELAQTTATRVAAVEQDYSNLWKEMQAVQRALVECQRLHRQDALQIAELQDQNAQQSRQIHDLSEKVQKQEMRKDETSC